MKILLIDDNELKSRAIIAKITSVLRGDGQQAITIARTLANAVRLISVFAFDLIILDLMLPYIEGGTPTSFAGLELLRQLRSEAGPNVAATVIGISAFPDEIVSSRPNFEELGVLITQFDDEGSWERPLRAVLERVGARANTPIDVDFLVFCALEEERRGFSHTGLEKFSEVIVSGLNLHYVRMSGDTQRVGGIVRLNQVGLVAATFEAAVALNSFRTKTISMSGICAGFSKEANLGQLIVASPAWEYQAGKWSANGFEIAPMQVPLRPTTRSVVDQVIGRDGFVENLELGIGLGVTRPSQKWKPKLAPFATGSAVIADVRKLEHIQRQHRKVAALDMETFGLYFSAHESSAAPQHFFSVKCVVDFADAKKDDDMHLYGCIIAARATEQIVRSLLDAG